MLGLPANTELNKQLPKTAIYTKFQMNTSEKAKIDEDISRIVIVNEISPARVHIEPGKEISSFFVLLVTLKRRDFSEKTIITLSKLIPQKMVLVLSYEKEAKLAVYHTKVIQTQWLPLDQLTLELKGLDLDKVWENVIVQIGSIQIESGNTLDQQIAEDERKARIQKEIARLEKLARAEKQPRKKFELVQRIKNGERFVIMQNKLILKCLIKVIRCLIIAILVALFFIGFYTFNYQLAVYAGRRFPDRMGWGRCTFVLWRNIRCWRNHSARCRCLEAK